MAKLLSRRTFLLGSATAWVGLPVLDLIYLEPRWIAVTQSVVAVPRERLAGPVRILHLSDFHLSEETPLPFIDRAVSLGTGRNPDLICVTGDFVTAGIPDVERYGAVLAKLSQRAPTFAVAGNHDGGEWAARLGGVADPTWLEELCDRSGMNFLHHRAAALEVRGTLIQLAGVGDLWSGPIDGASAFGAVDPDLYTVLLAHNPDTKDHVTGRSWDLMLSGHTHGGQLIVPFAGSAPLAPVQDKRFVYGLHSWGKRMLFITRGIGTFVGRFNCRPEVSVIDLVPG